MISRAPILVLFLVTFAGFEVEPQLRPTQIGPRLPEPVPDRVEVRFAVGKKPVQCKQFHLVAKVGSHTVLAGKFASGFQITPNLRNLPKNDDLELELRCGKFRWHFSEVGERAFLRGRWWVGTDYPPFQESFEGWPELQDATWVRYLIVKPSEESGFTVYRFCPAKLKNVKTGPCFTD